MFKRISVLLILAVAILGCSKDDDNSRGDSRRKYVSKIILEQNDRSMTMMIDYNNKMQITGYSSPNTLIRFEYENDRVVAIKEEINNDDSYKLYYTGGILSDIYYYSESYPVIYDAANRTYMLDGSGLEFGLDGRDISFFKSANSFQESFTYDTGKKGPLHDLGGEDIFPVTLFVNSMYYYLSAVPIKTITVDESGNKKTYVAENVYDNQGYLIETTQSSDGEVFFKINYEYKVK
ncbi:MAG: hypothetical protein EOO45_07975 [Flavobacterium sp.]|nr:MAG: hypothetical protein EOO45_07975 [Flavobacterium sp.]